MTKNLSYFKLGILFLSVSLFLWNCEKEEVLIEQQSVIETVSINEALALFNMAKSSLASKANNEQYAIPNLDAISQEEITNSNELLTVIPAIIIYDNVHSRILLLKIEGTIESVVFSMVRDEDSDTKQFSGKVYITDLEGNYINAFRVVDDVLVSRFLKPILTESKFSKNLFSKGDGDNDCWGIACGMEGEEIVVVAKINYPSVESLFGTGGGDITWDPWSGGSSSSSGSTTCSEGYHKDSSGNCVVDNFTEGCSEGYHKDNFGNCIANPVLSADCRSFEYAQPTGALLKACAVANLFNTFYAYGTENGKIGTFEAFVGYPLVFFTAPPVMTNGQAANLTAAAVTKAFRETSLWFIANAHASKQQVGAKLSSNILSEMAKFGGAMTQIPPFNIPSPAPYLASLTGTGNCI